MLFTSVDSIEDSPDADPVVGEELDPGVRLSRRHIFKVATVVGAGAVLPSAAWANSPSGKDGKGIPSLAPLSFEQILEQLKPLSKQLIADKQPNEDAYLHTIAALLSRLSPVPETESSGRGRLKMKALAKYRPLVVYQIDMEPGAKIRLHDHRFYNGVLFGVEGAADVRNFDLYQRDDIPPKGEEFLIRETQRLELTKGRISTLSRRRDNIHEVVAGSKGARLLDVFTYFSGTAGSHYLHFDDKPTKDDPRLYPVMWSKK